ncbi:MAG: contact-dependent growth inhibition system immunity protein [Candidatus Xenobia bacterium]
MKRPVSRPDALEVYRNADPGLSMAELDRRLGYRLVPPGAEAPDSQRWYARIQDKPMSELSDEDVTVVLENALHLPVMIPLAITRLKATPVAGMLYEGQMMQALAAAARILRPRFPELATQVRQALGELRPQLPPTMHPLLDDAWHELSAQE